MKNIIIFIAIVLLFSCETIVELDMPEHQPVMVLNSALEADSLCFVYLTHSRGAFEQDTIQSIKNANVTLMQQGSSIEMMLDSVVLNLDNPLYYYSYNNPLKSGCQYSIEVTHPDYNSVSSNTRIPQDINLINYDIITDTTATYNTTLTLNFIDNIDEENYYSIRLLSTESIAYSDYEDWDYENWYHWDKNYALELYSNDPSLSQGGIPWDGYAFSGTTAFFNDDLFDGEHKELVLDLNYNLNNLAIGDSLFLEFSSFSKEAYNYINSIVRSRNSFVSPFGTEPVSIYSNIENGIGAFIGANTLDTLLFP